MVFHINSGLEKNYEQNVENNGIKKTSKILFAKASQI
jgi:hypothetical protein